ncbi:MAG: DUF3106 domain-containing protein [Bryobacterales bacterium]|nr:DUF3106 domain-containing protein [Bryobacterales bacterium]
MTRWRQVGIMAAIGSLAALLSAQSPPAEEAQQAPTAQDTGAAPAKPRRMDRPCPGGGFGYGMGMRQNRPPFGRWRRLSREQWRKALAQLPPERQRILQERFDRLDRMPEPQRSCLEQRFERFRSLPSDQQQKIREAYRRMRELPPGERRMVHREYRYLAALPANERQARIESEEFRNRYTSEERSLLADLITAMPGF